MWSRGTGVIIAAALSLTACAELQPAAEPAVPDAPVVTEPAPPTEQDVLVEHLRLVALPAPEQARELQRLAVQSPTPRGSLQMALLLAHRGSAAELARAISLLDRLVQGGSEEDRRWQPLAQVLLDSWSEQRRLGDRIERQAQQLRESQRRQEQLSDTVAALKAIELSLPAKPAQVQPLPSPAAPAPAAPASGAPAGTP